MKEKYFLSALSTLIRSICCMKDSKDFHYTQGKLDFALTVELIDGELHTELNVLLEHFRRINEQT